MLNRITNRNVRISQKPLKSEKNGTFVLVGLGSSLAETKQNTLHASEVQRVHVINGA